jgi:hypothetical protein
VDKNYSHNDRETTHTAQSCRYIRIGAAACQSLRIGCLEADELVSGAGGLAWILRRVSNMRRLAVCSGAPTVWSCVVMVLPAIATSSRAPRVCVRPLVGAPSTIATSNHLLFSMPCTYVSEHS